MNKSSVYFSSPLFRIAAEAIFLFLLCISVSKVYSQGRYELNVAVGYSIPKMELYGPNVSFDALNPVVTVDGRRIVNSGNLGTTFGYGIQVTGSMKLIKTDYFKILGNISYTQFASKYSVPNSSSFYGVRINIFSLGAGFQINPIGIHRFYPSVIGSFRLNEIGGETYHFAGLDFFVVSPRFGYSAGMDLNYKFNKKVGMSFGMRYNYDNWLNKQTAVTDFHDDHAINFSDEPSAANGLAHVRRIVYVSILTGINIYFK